MYLGAPCLCTDMVPGDSPPRPGGLPAGYDDEDPYEGKDISSYPDWWQRNIREHERHQLRPYRPPRFEEGTLVPPLVTDLETTLDLDILLRAVDPAVGDDWSVLVDEAEVATIGRRRSGSGYTVYELLATEFESLVRSAVD